MFAADTNVLVRLLTEDDPEQLAAVAMVFDSGTVWIAKTVLLETEWVLRSGYKQDEGAVYQSFVRLLGLPNVELEDRKGVTDALALTLAGVQFADALHLSGRPPDAEFVTFDRNSVRRAKRAGVSGISELPR